ncbi:twin-arginine translocation signal domain-containing protein [Parabacteroides sp. 52]|uniref:Gfo/Idh/MocA family oxidoreductase n=1 Tax=unclassified Parabacteroides TaxID=2649774 RepID=UPI0013D4ACF0|nr:MULTISPECIES: Gfo/Idh/MocA family oxidoreductase [unclassified Parabacteroides]MDH6533823.1 putative dehydrogenase [Parabacteroides sp. PM5-20]NDV54573.1 twin-arginine translocation signal domain-containing protein [Parabacteroides sp. 52]
METTDFSRRDFLKSAAAMGGGSLLLSAFPWLQTFSKENQKEVIGEKAKIAIIGTGSRGMYHIQNILRVIPQAEIVALCDVYQPHLDQAAALCPKAKTYTDYRELLLSPEVEGVLIASPLHTHASLTIAGLNAGKHVFCEKSMARTLDDCKAMYDTYKQSGKVLYIGQQRLFDPKYIKAFEMVHNGSIGEVVGIRNYWFRNNDWRRPVSDPSLERHINWRLYKEYSGGLMTELATHQLQLGTWALKALPDFISGFGDIIFWKDGREVYDSVNVMYHYPNGVHMSFESTISNKFFGMGEQILGHKGTIELSKGKYYMEEPKPAPGIQQLINQIEHKVFDNVSFAGPSWVPETASESKGEYIVEKTKTHDGASSTGAVGDGSEELVAAFCHSVITGKPIPSLVEEAYYSSVLALLGIKAMEERVVMPFPDAYKIPYLNHSNV